MAYLVLGLLTGFLLAERFLGRRANQPVWAFWLLHGGVAVGVGIGLTSFLSSVLIFVGAATAPVLWGVEVLVAASLLWARFRRPPGPSTLHASAGRSRWDWLLACAFAATLLPVLAATIDSFEVLPHGEWDAWSIWNLRAKYLAGPGESWGHAVSPLLNRTHPHYPLLTPAIVAALWKTGGEVSTLAPAAVSLLFFLAVIALLVGSLGLLRGPASAWLAGAVLLASISYTAQPPAQYADVPLSFYLLGALAFIALSAPGGRSPMLAAAGFLASCAAWTKNEGLVFSALVLLGAPLFIRPWRPLWLGALPGLLVVAAFKTFLAPADTTLGGQTASQALARFTDGDRYSQILSALWREIGSFGTGFTHPLLLLAVLAFALRFRVDSRWVPFLRFGSMALCLQFGSYLLVFLLTPLNLAWYLSTALGRLLCHVWPGFLFLAFLALGRLEDQTAAAPERARKPSPLRRRRR